MLEAEIGGAVASAAVTGDLNPLVRALDDFVDVATQSMRIHAATAGDVEVQFEKVAAFYNQLSELHTTLRKQLGTLHDRALTIHSTPAGGHVAGVQKAWASIARTAGVQKHADSLYGNLLAIDHLVLTHMEAIQHNVTNYAAQEHVAIVGFGKAVSATPTAPSAAPAAGAAATGAQPVWK